MNWRLLIDECLSPSLVRIANEAGFEATCTRDRGWLGTKDRVLIKKIIAHDYTFVTCNSKDFRGHGAISPGGHYALQELHCGLICLNSHSMMTLERQQRLFRHLLASLSEKTELINQALEIFEEQNGSLMLIDYALFKQPK
ncbi:DUF5615 family PIN-like protein [Duganella radicis]|uniref:DUF5615 domain-containing protein n=1 Tax=Duganella radicis TaxID=551988 RepID=A0A6L6PS08_9BURK|nr:DUF5615 family PIN-like protein [Duganella radicis]MTV41883.1 hypothetical protein [Duganella radicis]